MKPDLHKVTAVVCDHRNPRAAVKLLAAMSDVADFGDLKYLNLFQGYPQSNYWMNFELWKYIQTDFALFMQLDGYIVYPERWDPAWLNYDYIGAPWPADWTTNETGRHRVGNDGFCLKSRRLLHQVARLPWREMPSDVFVCCQCRAQLEFEGFKFAPPEAAARFSVEHLVPETPAQTFGFHGPSGALRWPAWDAERSHL